MSSVYDLLLKPVVTEKSTLLQEQGKYVFEVFTNKLTPFALLLILLIMPLLNIIPLNILVIVSKCIFI